MSQIINLLAARSDRIGTSAGLNSPEGGFDSTEGGSVSSVAGGAFDSIHNFFLSSQLIPTHLRPFVSCLREIWPRMFFAWCISSELSVVKKAFKKSNLSTESAYPAHESTSSCYKINNKKVIRMSNYH